MVWNFYLLSQKIRRDRQRKNFLKQGVQNMFSSAISGGIFLRHLAGSNSLYSNRTERSDAYTAVCSARKGVMRRGCLTGRDDRKSDRFAADERKAGERTGVVNAPVRPTNARSAGIFKGL